MTTQPPSDRPPTFLEELDAQRWDDHRYYHRHRFNQSLHLLSALCFFTAFALMLTRPLTAAIFGWCVAMWPRQIGHFFFEPRGYDDVNQASFEHKESVKVGFNLQRKVMLFIAWLSVPVFLLLSPSFFGLLSPYGSRDGFYHSLGVLWIGLALVGLLGRTAWLCATRGVQTGLVWCTKILSDPYHDVKIYYRSPLLLLKGEVLDPMTEGQPRRAPAAPSA